MLSPASNTVKIAWVVELGRAAQHQRARAPERARQGLRRGAAHFQRAGAHVVGEGAGVVRGGAAPAPRATPLSLVV